jgi:DNA-binding cell septation regulator SpoVG
MAAIEVVQLRHLSGAGCLRALASVRLGGLVVHEFRIVQQPGQRAWVSPPQRPTRPRADGTGSGWVALVEIPSKALKEKINEIVLAAFAGAPPGVAGAADDTEGPALTKRHETGTRQDPREARVDALARQWDAKGPDDLGGDL